MLFNKPFLLGGTSRFNFSTTSSSKEKVKDDSEGFARLTKHYKERQAMKGAIVDFEAEMTFNHLPYGIRFFMFLNRIKFRIFVLATLAALFSYWGNLLGLAGSRVERWFKKYKKRWIYRYNRPALVYKSAMETRFEPTKMSRPSTDKLSQHFIAIDRELEEYGYSRQLVADCLKRMDFLQTKEELTKFFDESPHSYHRSKKL